MKSYVMVALAMLLMVATCVSAQQDMSPEQAEAMMAWQKAATPGEFHAFFGKYAGQWQVDGLYWMAPEAEPIPSQSKCSSKMILGGRFLMEEFDGVSMGMPFQGLGITGYDNTTGQVTMVWYDNMGTVTSIMSGPGTKPGAMLGLEGSMSDPVSKGDLPFRVELTFISDDERVFTYYSSMAVGIPEYKMMEQTYKRMK